MRPFLVLFFLLILNLITPSMSDALDANTLPAGGEAVSGSAFVTETSNSLEIYQFSEQLIVDWKTFDIGEKASVVFNQPDHFSIALNRIQSDEPSQILGQLTANGHIFLINPAGILFGPKSQVNVGGLIASTLNITDEHFKTYEWLFDGAPQGSKIILQGSIQTKAGGYLAFMAPSLFNNGVLNTPNSTIFFTRANRVLLDPVGDGLIQFSIFHPPAQSTLPRMNLFSDAMNCEGIQRTQKLDIF